MIRRTFSIALAWLLVLLVAQSTVHAESGSFDSNGVKIHYIVEGNPDGPPVLLIHGFTANVQTQWALPGIINKLKGDFKVIALDNRGHGKSGKPHDPEKYGLEMVEDAVRLMDHLGIEKAHVVGYSMGGFITNKLLTTHPDRVITATLGGAGWSREDSELLNLLNELAESLEQGKGIGPLIKRLTPADQPEPTEEQIQSFNQLVMLANDPLALAAAIRGMTNLVVPEEALKSNKVPTLALIGERDPLKEGVDLLETVMSNLEVVVIDGADHMTAFSNQAFAKNLQEFLTEHSPKAEAQAAGASK